MNRLKAWRVYRMLFSPDPLGKRLTLLWHNDFATSNETVQDLALMRRQNETHRHLGSAPFAELPDAAVRWRWHASGFRCRGKGGASRGGTI
jgi:uncharacterized protein (DUF1800 family)